jgi:hypothetical protein
MISRSSAIIINVIICSEMCEVPWRHVVSCLFKDFSDHALQITLSALAVAAKKPNLTGVQDAGNVIALLEQKAA